VADAQYPITLAEFRAWLLTKRPTAVVGVRDNPVCCPAAGYLKARGDESPSVGRWWVTRGRIGKRGYREYRAPEWLGLFTELVDKGDDKPSRVQARTALRLLDKVAHASLPDEDDWERTALESEAVSG